MEDSQPRVGPSRTEQGPGAPARFGWAGSSPPSEGGFEVRRSLELPVPAGAKSTAIHSLFLKCLARVAMSTETPLNLASPPTAVDQS